jgi:hypothetical protein
LSWSSHEIRFRTSQALYALLAAPDPPELHRGFTLRLEGKPDRYLQLSRLANAWVQMKLLEVRERRLQE